MNRGSDKTTAAALILGLAMLSVGPSADAAGSPPERFADSALSLEERTQLRCPPPDAPGPFATPSNVEPSPGMVLWTTYSADDELVRLTAEDTAENADLGAGHDAALLYATGTGLNVMGGNGDDTLAVCSMEDLRVSLVLSAWGGRTADRDVVVVEAPVFDGIPPGMRRVIALFQFDTTMDRLVVHAPTELLASPRSSRRLGGVRLGDVLIRLYTATGTPALTYPLTDEAAIRLVPAGN